jgi:hypothetical protein
MNRMPHYLNLFSPETWQRFRENGGQISGFRERQRPAASRIEAGSLFVCYLTGLSRWCGLLEIESGPFEDSTPIFADPDPFKIRFRVKSIVALDPKNALPIYDEKIWPNLSFTRNEERGTSRWTGPIRASLGAMDDEDSALLVTLLRRQADELVEYPISPEDHKKLARGLRVRTIEGEVAVEVPEAEEESEKARSTAPDVESSARQSSTVQASLAEMGSKMHFRVWLPPADRARVAALVSESTRAALLERLPLNYDDVTLRTIEQIDLIWLKGRAMTRAFEIEHTTAVYSGILRMADLLALQPNMNIRLHIVAPDDRRDKVKQEIMRPVFSLLSSGPLYDSCTFLSYSSIDELKSIEHLQYMNDEIIAEFEERADE